MDIFLFNAQTIIPNCQIDVRTGNQVCSGPILRETDDSLEQGYFNHSAVGRKGVG